MEASKTFLDDRLAKLFLAGPPLHFAMLFGSVAMGTDRANSDIDVGIYPVDLELSLQDELTLQTQLARVSARNVDRVRLDRAPTLVRWQVVRYGRLIVEPTPFAAARFVAASVADYLDFAPAFE